MGEALIEGPKESDDEASAKFFREGISDEHKLALLNFATREFLLKQPAVLRGRGSAVAAQLLVDQCLRQRAKIDLLYLDADALRDCSPMQIDQLWSVISRRGIICIDTDSAANVGTPPAAAFKAVLSIPGFSVFTRGDGERPIRSICYQLDLFLRKLNFERQQRLQRDARATLPEVAVVVLTYKHAAYIAECLRSVLSQRGNFRMHVIVVDDASPDDTAAIVRAIINENGNSAARVSFQTNEVNVGVVANLASSIDLAAGCDYLTFCEGDDFWTSHDRIQRHVEFLNEHAACAMSFNSIELCDAHGGARKPFEIHEALQGVELDGAELADQNFIGNFTACFYRGELIDSISPRIFDMYSVDWFFNLYCSQFGKIGHIKELLSVYRQHPGGEWSSRRGLDKALELLRLIGKYDEFLDYRYDESFYRYSASIYGTVDHAYSGEQGRLDLLIVDDVFPSSQSGFRYAEFTSYLREIDSSLVLATGKTLHIVEENSIDSVIRGFRRRHPELAHKVRRSEGGFPLRLANLVYVNFLGNVWALLPEIEAARTPFVFTLYPGAHFLLNDAECDSKLKRVFDSPYFQKVIVTQQVTYDYLASKGLCPAEKVLMVFGVVMPELRRLSGFPAKRRWGFGKPRLDICFMAHRYTAHGEDKGYDVFVNAASVLRERHDDIHFHVVGPYDKLVLNVNSFGDRLTFHGSLNQEDFDDFFQDMDIILSPNIGGKIRPGSFDGFPTASCIEAGMRGTAIFAVDEFGSAKGHFAHEEDIVLINYDLVDIVGKVERYYADPHALKMIGEQGARRIRELYSHEAQMEPRINLLRQIISRSGPYSNEVLDAMPPKCAVIADNTRPRKSSSARSLLGKVCPRPIKDIYRAWKGNHASR